MSNMEVGLLSRAGKFLEDNGQIRRANLLQECTRMRCARSRCVSLCLQTIFDQLVSLYAPLFQCHWQQFKYLVKESALPPGVDPWTHATRAYISAWIYDLYISNRKAVKSLCFSTFQQYYSHKEFSSSQKYDKFLIHLNAAIRPTYIIGTMEDALYIPILSDSPAWDTDNPFHIENFILDSHLVSGIRRNSRVWSMSTIVSDAPGRPSWMFDWHQHNCCAWFPPENYSRDDICIAYVVGAPCSPNLGPRDADDWQTGMVPENSNAKDYDRVVDRRFYGAYEVRTLEKRQISNQQDQMQNMPILVEEATQGQGSVKKRKKKANAKSSNSKGRACMTDCQFRLTVWTYYHRVIWEVNDNARSNALMMIALSWDS